MKFDPDNYDVLHVGISGGKDSTALLLWVVNESGWDLSKLEVTFCDTGNEDPLTYAYIKMLNDLVWTILPLHPERDFWQLVQWKGRFPATRARFCTSFLKIIPTREHIFEYIKDSKNVLLVNGVRKAEGTAANDRGEVPQFNFDEGFGADCFRPILKWPIEDVWAIHNDYLKLDDVLALIGADPTMAQDKKEKLTDRMKDHGVPRNPLYDMDAKRVGCFPCINSRKLEIRAMAEYRPERIDFIEEKEGSFKNRHMYGTMFHRSTVPIDHRSKEIVTKSGERMKVCTIRDVVQWSKTKHGGKQFEMNLDIPVHTISCEIGGMCE